eukprot:gene40405-54644_t
MGQHAGVRRHAVQAGGDGGGRDALGGGFGFDVRQPGLETAAALASWEVAASLGLTMVVMYAPGKPTTAALRRIIALARRFPHTIIALDHCGWPGVEHGVAGTIGPEHLELVDIPNIVFKFTQINLNRFRETGIDAAKFVRLIVDTYGVGRVMWGSDYGNTKDAYPDMVAQAIAATSLLSDAERARAVCGSPVSVAPEPPAIDAHAHVFTRAMPFTDTAWTHPDYDYPVEAYLAELDAHGIAFGVITAASLF